MHNRPGLAAAAVLMLSATVASAQAPVPVPHLRIGPVLSATFANFSGNDASGSSGHTFFGGGLQGQMSLKGPWFLASGVHYMSRGAEDTGLQILLKMTYVEVPLLVGYEIPTAGGVHPYLMGGAQLGFNTGCKFEDTSGSGQEANCDDPAIGFDASSTDWAFVGGGGVAFTMGAGRLGADVRYNLGMQNVESTSDLKHSGFTISASYMFALGH